MKERKKEGRKRHYVPSKTRLPDFYHAKINDILLMEEKVKKENELEKKRLKELFLFNKKQYAKEIRTKYLPKIDVNKREEIEKRREKEIEIELRRKKGEEYIAKMGSKLPDIFRSTHSWHTNRNVQNSTEERKSFSQHKTKEKELDIIQEAIVLDEPLLSAQQKSQRLENGGMVTKMKKMGDEYLSQSKKGSKKRREHDLSLEELRENALALEKKIRRKEYLFKKKVENADDIHNQEVVSNIIFDALQTKIQLLQKIH